MARISEQKDVEQIHDFIEIKKKEKIVVVEEIVRGVSCSRVQRESLFRLVRVTQRT